MGKDFDSLLEFIVILLGAAVVIKILDEATKHSDYKCPRCGILVNKYQNPCPNCRAPIRWV